ncbi:MAG: helix-turn-helix transcriptional regulator, partial [Deltaproteobacteria bacterium]
RPSGRSFEPSAAPLARAPGPPASSSAEVAAASQQLAPPALDGTKLGTRIRELRLAAGLTQAELARRTGIHRPNIARVEAGRHTPSLETLARLAAAIGVPTASVLDVGGS